MHIKRYPILVWFLSEDLELSAQWLSNKQLVKTINGCYSAICCARFYFMGIRNFTHYKYYFDKSRKSETMEHFFPFWPLKLKPPFNAYKTKLSKWCRMCKEHYDYMCRYLDICLSEYEYRYLKPHGMSKFLGWLKFDAPNLNIPEGHILKISIPWKMLNPKFRSKDVHKAYRDQYKSVLLNDGIKIDDFKRRDIPEWLIDSKEADKWMQ